jgi:hypothetical protein
VRHKQEETHTISSSATSSEAARVLRAHMRSPLVLLAGYLALSGDTLIGVILAGRVYARPVPEDSSVSRYQESLKIRGRIAPTADGGSEVSLSVYAPRAFRTNWCVLTFGVAVLCMALYFATGRLSLLILVAWFAGFGLYGELARRLNRSTESSERTLVATWIDAVARDLPHANR